MCNDPKFYKERYNPLTGKLVPLPCRVCSGCRIDYKMMWSRRLTSEYVCSRSAFVTFTYDDYHLKFNRGSIYPTLCMKDFSKYIDNMRHSLKYLVKKGWKVPEYSDINFKYFCCSEYGETTYPPRPHYHCLFFGLDFHDFRDFFLESWPYGSVVKVLPILQGGINYVVKYMDKQQFGEYRDRDFFDFGIEAPSMVCSKGIGKHWFLSQIDNINKYGCLKIGNRLVPCPPYWKNKLFNYCDKNVYRVQKFKDSRLADIERFVQHLGYNSYDDYLKVAKKEAELANYKIAHKRGEGRSVLDIARHLDTRFHDFRDYLHLNTSPLWLDSLDIS